MEGEMQLPPAAAADSAAVSKVLDDDNLLIEILLRVGVPTTLVRAAVVCKAWLHRVSDPAFLRHFRELHPPRLLGFYKVSTFRSFVPILPQPPEYAAIIDRASRSAQKYQCMDGRIKDCRNGNIFLRFPLKKPPIVGVLSALFPERPLAVLPPLPASNAYGFAEVLSREDVEGGDMSYLYVLSTDNPVTTVHVYLLRDGVWSLRASATGHLPRRKSDIKAVLVDDKIYMAADVRDIIISDLTNSSFSTTQLPQGVEYGRRDTMLSRADDPSGIYLIQAKELQIRIWLHKGENWLLVDTICLHDMCANLRMSDCTVVRIKQVGDNAEFVFLQMGRTLLYLDIKCRTLRKVYEIRDRDQIWGWYIYPLKMSWPPAFPALQD